MSLSHTLYCRSLGEVGMRLLVSALLLGLCPAALDAQEVDWSANGRDAQGTRYSPASQITRKNVSGLEVAWTYRTGETDPRFKTGKPTAFEATPLLVDGTMYLGTPLGRGPAARQSQTTAGPTRRAGRCAPTMPGAGRAKGRGTRFRRTRRTRSMASGAARWHRGAARPTPGRCWLRTLSGIWSLSPLAVPLRTTTACSASGTTATPTRSWRCEPRPASWSGRFRPCTTTSGITTTPRRRRWRRSPA